jgi:hypothetical protein
MIPFALGVIASSIRKIAAPGGGTAPSAATLDANTTCYMPLNALPFTETIGSRQLVNNSVTLVDKQASFNGNGYMWFMTDAAMGFGAGPWTMEGFITTTNTGMQFLLQVNNGGASFNLLMYGGGGLTFQANDQNTGALSGPSASVADTDLLRNGMRGHWAVTYDGTTARIFIRGKLVSSMAIAYNMGALSNQMNIGGRVDGSSSGRFIGQMDGLAFSKTCRYVADFTPPGTTVTTTTGFSMDAYTSVLMHMNDTQFVDEAGHVFTNTGVGIVANASSSGGFAANFTGAGELYTAGTANLVFGNGPWSIEYTITTAVQDGARYHVACYDSDGWVAYTYNENFYFYTENGASPVVSGGTAIIADGKPHKIQISFDGTTVRIFIDGVTRASQPTTYNFATQRPFSVGGLASGNTNVRLTAQIDEVRISKGIARNVSDYTPA